jgi:hypothetical protein
VDGKGCFNNGRGNRGHKIRAKLTCLVASMALALVASACTVASGTTAASAMTLVATSGSVTDYSYPGIGAILNLPIYVMPVGSPFDIRLTRASYSQPVVAEQIASTGNTTQTITLPAGMVNDFLGLPNFFHIVVANSVGKRVLDSILGFCPVADKRLTRDAVANSIYPKSCSVNPFALGSVWGIPPGWGAQIADGAPAQLSRGTYVATVSVTDLYQRLFNISAQPETVKVTIRTVPGQPPLTTPSAPAPTRGESAIPPPGSPTGNSLIPDSLRPELSAEPAWGIHLAETESVHHAPEDLLQFNATVWNAGPVPLVIAGFRPRPGTAMKAYQYFYTPAGKLAGDAPAGTLYYDSDSGHNHWHYTDLATYLLLSADKRTILISQKTGFCLANTDIVDYTIKGAEWQPNSAPLDKSCGAGNPDARTVQMSLEVGSGDTYLQQIAGQAFNVTNLPDGVYYIEITVDPLNNLHLAGGGTRTSLRQIQLSGKAGARVVTVQQIGLVDSN